MTFEIIHDLLRAFYYPRSQCLDHKPLLLANQARRQTRIRFPKRTKPRKHLPPELQARNTFDSIIALLNAHQLR